LFESSGIVAGAGIRHELTGEGAALRLRRRGR
jgi:hypothetical protein